MTDLILAIAHHLAVFALVSIFGAEFILLRPGLSGQRLRQLVRLDRVYGAVSGLVILVGVLRVIFGTAGWEFYVGNWAFWTKMGLFAAVGLLSIQPTIRILRWGRTLARDAAFVPAEADIEATRRFVHTEALLLLLIPIFAALVPRLYGL